MLAELVPDGAQRGLRRPSWLYYRDGKPAPWPAVAMVAVSAVLLLPVVSVVVSRSRDHVDWLAFGAMLAAALLTPFFTANGVRQQVFVLIGAVGVMAAVLLSPPQALAVTFVATSVDFVKRRCLPGNPGTLAGLSGFSNSVTYLWATLACAAGGGARHGGATLGLGLLPLVAAATFVCVAESGFATYIKLGWGHRFRDLLTPRARSRSSSGSAAWEQVAHCSGSSTPGPQRRSSPRSSSSAKPCACPTWRSGQPSLTANATTA
jgi:hypothetical protein